MSEAVVQDGVTPEASPEGTPEQTAEPQAQQHDKGDLEARLRNEPDFAVNEYKKLQAELSRRQQAEKALEPVRRVAEFVGGGDIAQGAEAAQQHLINYSKMRSDPTMLKLIERWEQTGRVPGLEDDSFGMDTMDEPDPRDVELQQLKETVARLQGNTAKTQVRDAVSSFYRTEVGSVLNDEERAEVAQHVTTQVENWSRTPAGQAMLKDLNDETISVLVNQHLVKQGKLGEIGERIHLKKLEKRRGATTDGPSSVPSAASEQGEFNSTLDALKWAMANPDKL